MLAVFGGGFGLIETLQRAVVALVQAPGADDGDPHLVELLGDHVVGLDGALEQRGIAEVEDVTFALENLAGFERLGDAFFTEVDVGPAGEAILFVPRALAVADEDEFIHPRLLQKSASGAAMEAGNQPGAHATARFTWTGAAG